jgi:hypothetical protein
MDQMATRTPPVPDLAEYADEHLVYEAQMFVYAKSLSPSPQDRLGQSVAVELTALHFRNLLDFFYPGNPKPDDVVATDYVADWEQRRPIITIDLQSARTRANKEVAHLTAQRIAGIATGKAWHASHLGDLLRPVVAAFLAAPNPHLSNKTQVCLKQI